MLSLSHVFGPSQPLTKKCEEKKERSRFYRHRALPTTGKLLRLHTMRSHIYYGYSVWECQIDLLFRWWVKDTRKKRITPYCLLSLDLFAIREITGYKGPEEREREKSHPNGLTGVEKKATQIRINYYALQRRVNEAEKKIYVHSLVTTTQSQTYTHKTRN